MVIRGLNVTIFGLQKKNILKPRMQLTNYGL